MGHSHIEEGEGTVLIAKTPRNIMLALIGLATILTGFGLVTLWPNYDKVSEISDTFQSQSTAPGVTFPEGKITAISENCEGSIYGGGSQVNESGVCKIAEVLVLSGAKEGQTVQVQLFQQAISSNLVVGDTIKLVSVPNDYTHYENSGTNSAVTANTSEYFYGVERNSQLLILFVVFVVVVVVVARLRGFLALISLTIAG